VHRSQGAKILHFFADQVIIRGVHSEIMSCADTTFKPKEVLFIML
jgi:hypothetical protein